MVEPSTWRNCFIRSGWAGHAGADTRFPSVWVLENVSLFGTQAPPASSTSVLTVWGIFSVTKIVDFPRLKEAELPVGLYLWPPCAAIQWLADAGGECFEKWGGSHFQDSAVQRPAADMGKNEP